MRERVTRTMVFAALAAVATMAAAQGEGAGGGTGDSGLGRMAYDWNADLDAEKERLAELEKELAALPIEEWKEKTLAWVEIAVDREARTIVAPEAFRVGGLEADRKAEVVQEGEEPELAWTITYPKKEPRILEVILTDVDSTRVECGLQNVWNGTGGHLGVILHGTTLRCLFHPGGGSPSAVGS